MPRSDVPKPSYATKNMRIIGHTDQGGRGDGQQIMVRNGYAYVGHVCSRGFSIIDVRDPTKPKTVNYIENPPNTWSLHHPGARRPAAAGAGPRHVHAHRHGGRAELLQAEGRPPRRARGAEGPELVGRHGRLGHLQADRAAPASASSPIEGTGIHRIWYVGGRWAYASAMIDGFSDYIFIVIDLKNPAKPKIVGRYWLPGMNLAAGEKAELAAADRPLRPAPRRRPRRHRLRRLARRLPRRHRREGQDQPEAHRRTRPGRRPSAAARTIACRSPAAIC